MTRFALRAAALIVPLLAAGPALAHGGHTEGFGAGLAHPLIGLDHLFAMLAIGIWAAQGGLPRPWALPACFLGGMAVGIGLGMVAAVPPLEQTVAGTLVVLGVMVALTARVRAGLAFPAAALFGLVHGSVHGLEIGGAPLATTLGMLLASAGLHALGFVAARGLARRDMVVRASGAAIASVGVMLLVAG
ncbi:HupE/UreJ family protein [Neoroseomonas rubea]|uniref:HupE/UreJ family protein n=1 Tax=Neoroseomonas rubea TaxID=2748666 RepID=UPI0018DF967D|nr:HupE/UreJ family protein [Roseomonas rubea]